MEAVKKDQRRVQADVDIDVATSIRVLAAKRDVTVPTIVQAALENYLASQSDAEKAGAQQ
jgi:hypothetical protein